MTLPVLDCLRTSDIGFLKEMSENLNAYLPSRFEIRKAKIKPDTMTMRILIEAGQRAGFDLENELTETELSILAA